METASKWTQTSTIRQIPATPGEAEAVSGDWLNRLRFCVVRACSVAFGARRRYRAAEGATDAELARLARTSFTIDDARWRNARQIYGGGRHV